MNTAIKTKTAPAGLLLRLHPPAAGIITVSGIRSLCSQWLLLLLLGLTGLALTPAASAQAPPPGTPTYQQLKSFGTVSQASGAWPQDKLMQGADGALYGTAPYGGSYDAGTVFKLNLDGSGFTVLKNLDYNTTGGYPDAGLIQGSDGALYGTTHSGGSSMYGTAFKINPDGTGFTVLKNFDLYTTGGYPVSGLIQGPGADGALYGTASEGGSSGYGTVFKLNTNGTGFGT